MTSNVQHHRIIFTTIDVNNCIITYQFIHIWLQNIFSLSLHSFYINFFHIYMTLLQLHGHVIFQ